MKNREPVERRTPRSLGEAKCGLKTPYGAVWVDRQTLKIAMCDSFGPRAIVTRRQRAFG